MNVDMNVDDLLRNRGQAKEQSGSHAPTGRCVQGLRKRVRPHGQCSPGFAEARVVPVFHGNAQSKGQAKR